MDTVTKKVVVNGQEMVMSSLDGRTWFLRTESLYEFEERMRHTAKSKREIDELEMEEMDELIGIAD